MSDLQIITEPGVYFNIPDKVYHASPGLSSSGIKNLLISPLDFWVASVDPEREDVDTEANIFGRAMHRRTLEGKEDFYNHYAILPAKEDYPDTHYTLDQLKMLCTQNRVCREKTRAGTIANLVQEVPGVEIFDNIIDKFKVANEGKIILRADQGREIETRHEIIDMHPDAQKAFRNGRAEVSIFWRDEETGLLLKSRIDYLKINASVDLKTFTNQRRAPVDRAIGMSVAQYQYHIQGFFYKRAVEAAKKMLINEKPSEHILEYISSPANSDFIEALIECPEHDFWFVFIESGKAPNIRVRRLDKKSPEGSTNSYWHAAEIAFNRGVEIYKAFKEAHPDPATPWHEYVRWSPFEDHDFPLYMLD